MEISGDRIVGRGRTWAEPTARREPAIDPVAVDAFVKKVFADKADAVRVVLDGRVIIDAHRAGVPRELRWMSMSKTVTALSVGIAIDQGLLEGLDQRASDLIPEWRDDARNEIRLRHLLSHSSGLTTEKRYREAGPAALSAMPLVTRPGERVEYSSNAVDIAGGLIAAASGLSFERFNEKNLFAPLGVRVSYEYPRGAGGSMRGDAIGLSKVGQLVVNGGQWNGQRLVSAEWIDRCLEQSHPADPSGGLLTWREGVREAPRDGRCDHFLSGTETPTCYSARGWLGQRLVMEPGRKLVAVRLRDNTAAAVRDQHDQLTFYKDALALISPKG